MESLILTEISGDEQNIFFAKSGGIEKSSSQLVSLCH